MGVRRIVVPAGGAAAAGVLSGAAGFRDDFIDGAEDSLDDDEDELEVELEDEPLEELSSDAFESKSLPEEALDAAS